MFAANPCLQSNEAELEFKNYIYANGMDWGIVQAMSLTELEFYLEDFVYTYAQASQNSDFCTALEGNPEAVEDINKGYEELKKKKDAAEQAAKDQADQEKGKKKKKKKKENKGKPPQKKKADGAGLGMVFLLLAAVVLFGVSA